MDKERVSVVRLDDNEAFDPAPGGFTGPCFLEVAPSHRKGRGRFYREGGKDYTNFPTQAGIWKGQAAFDRCGDSLKLYPIPVENVISALGKTIERLQLRMAE